MAERSVHAHILFTRAEMNTNLLTGLNNVMLSLAGANNYASETTTAWLS